MNQIQTQKLERLSYDEDTLLALKEIAYKIIGIDNILDEIEKQPTNQLKGEKIHAIIVAKNIVDDFFMEIERYKQDEITEITNDVVK